MGICTGYVSHFTDNRYTASDIVTVKTREELRKEVELEEAKTTEVEEDSEVELTDDYVEEVEAEETEEEEVEAEAETEEAEEEEAEQVEAWTQPDESDEKDGFLPNDIAANMRRKFKASKQKIEAEKDEEIALLKAQIEQSQTKEEKLVRPKRDDFDDDDEFDAANEAFYGEKV